MKYILNLIRLRYPSKTHNLSFQRFHFRFLQPFKRYDKLSARRDSDFKKLSQN